VAAGISSTFATLRGKEGREFRIAKEGKQFSTAKRGEDSSLEGMIRGYAIRLQLVMACAQTWTDTKSDVKGFRKFTGGARGLQIRRALFHVMRLWPGFTVSPRF
jgi:hypothetical protein